MLQFWQQMAFKRLFVLFILLFTHYSFYAHALTIKEANAMLDSGVYESQTSCSSLLLDLNVTERYLFQVPLTRTTLSTQDGILRVENLHGTSRDSDLIPGHLTHLHNKTPKSLSLCNGTNCINAVLLWHQMLAKIDYTWFEDFSKIKKEKFVEINADNSSIQYGDIGIIQGAQFDFEAPHDLHAFIFVGQENGRPIIWNKPSASENDPWTFQYLSDAFSFYREHYLKLHIQILRKM